MSSTPPIPVPPLDDELVKSVKAGECILFLGAGAHYPPKTDDPDYAGCYTPAQQPPVGKALASILASETKIATDANYSSDERRAIAENLQRISLYYELEKGRDKLITKVKGAVSDGKEPSRAVKALAELNFPIICTTNYDKLFEKALVLAGKSPIVSVYSNERYNITKDYMGGLTPPIDTPFLFKIHSDIDDPTNSMVITDEDYISFILRMITGFGQNDPIPRVFRSHMPIWPMLFIGFSLLDYNLRLLFKLLSWQLQAPTSTFSYSVGPYPDGLIRQKYSPPVKFIAQDIWAFVPELYREVTGKPMP